MMVASEADEAWWPPTFSLSVFSRRWLAWWMVQLASHSTLRSSSPSIARSYWEIISCIGVSAPSTRKRSFHEDVRSSLLFSGFPGNRRRTLALRLPDVPTTKEVGLMNLDAAP